MCLFELFLKFTWRALRKSSRHLSAGKRTRKSGKGMGRSSQKIPTWRINFIVSITSIESKSTQRKEDWWRKRNSKLNTEHKREKTYAQTKHKTKKRVPRFPFLCTSSTQEQERFRIDFQKGVHIPRARKKRKDPKIKSNAVQMSKYTNSLRSRK